MDNAECLHVIHVNRVDQDVPLTVRLGCAQRPKHAINLYSVTFLRSCPMQDMVFLREPLKYGDSILIKPHVVC